MDRGLVGIAILAIGLAYAAVASYRHVDHEDVLTFGPSMTPTITTGSHISLDGHAYDSAQPQVGDIVSFQGPAGTYQGLCAVSHPASSPCPVASDDYEQIRLLKRVVAVPGDHVSFTADGRVIRDGRVADEPYINPCPGSCALPQPIVVPADHYFMAGDNRPDSTDSRFFGPVPREAIDGRVRVGSG